VCETHCRTVQETCCKTVCCTTYTNEVQTCYRECVKTVCRPVTTCKTVEKKCGEWVTEQYCIPGRTHIRLERACDECCFDPCTCQTHHKRGGWHLCTEKCPDTVGCKQVWKTHTVCETVPCTTYVKECVHEQVPYTVCKRVPHTETKQVPYTVCKTIPETVVKQVPYTVTRIQKEIVREQVPYTVTRSCKGAYVDAQGVGHECEGANPDGSPWCFQCGAHYEKTFNETVCRMVQEQCVKKVPYTVYRTVQEECVKQVPYTVCRMVPHTVKKCVPVTTCETVQEVCHKKVPYTVCHMESYTVCKQVPYTVCKQVPYTYTVKVPYTVTECVPTTVCKRVPTQVCEEVCVRRCHRVPVCENVSCECPRESWLNRLFSHHMGGECGCGCESGCDSGCGGK
jgi:hypothetical protein